VEYFFTPKGEDLMPIFYEIMKWSFEHENDCVPARCGESPSGTADAKKDRR